MELFKLFGTIEVDNSKANKALDETSNKGSQTQSKLSGAWSKIGSAAVAVGKTVATGMAAGGAAVAGLVTKSVQAYADYEQLVGGVDTLFKGSSDKVQKYAANAFKTAGLSANEYMETVTSFSASLLQSLDGDTSAAAEKANLAITDMSDNANKMGTDMGLIQNAYQGFAKANYTMLDNLKLGYGGTKEEMERLLEDASKISGIEYDISSYADVVDAIHVIQTEMGITGTTAKEAQATISGSIEMTKSAWENLMVGLASGNADIPKLVSNVVSSGAQVLKNIIPVAKQVIESIPAAISEISPKAGAAFQGMIDFCKAALPVLKDAVTTTFTVIEKAFNFVREHTGALTAVATAIGIIVAALGMYNAVAAVKAAMAAAEVTTVWGLVKAYAAQAVAMMSALAPYLAIAAAIAAVVAIGVVLYKNWDTIKEKCAELGAKLKEIWGNIKTSVSEKVEEIKTDLSERWTAIKESVSVAIENIRTTISEKFTAAKDAVVSVFTAMVSAISAAWETIKNAVQVALMFIGSLISAAFQIITLPFRLIWENCKQYVISAWNAIKSAVSSALNAVKTTVTNVLTAVKNKITSIWNSVKSVTSSVFNSVKSVVTSIWNSVKTVITNAVNAVKSKVTSIWNAVKSTTSSVFNSVKSVVTSVWNSIKTVVTNAVNNVKSKVTSVWNSVKSTTSSVFNSVKSTVTSVWNSIKSAISSAINGVKSTISSGLNSAKSTASGVLDGIKSKFSSVFESVKSTVSNAIGKIKGMFNFSWSLPKLKLPHFKIKGKFSLDPPSVPKLSVEWYKKAMQNPMLLTSPTIFGYDAASGKYQGAGEAGAEVVSGANTLMDMIGSVVYGKMGAANEKIVALLTALLEAVTGGNEELLRALLAGQVIKINEREFGRTVREYA